MVIVLLLNNLLKAVRMSIQSLKKLFTRTADVLPGFIKWWSKFEKGI
jgi:hypothetical protein